jgi:transcriptional regulator with XRE-family HTH domain
VVTTAVLRKSKGITLQAVCDHINEEHGLRVDRGTISAIENGHRGGSAKMLAAYADAIGIAPASIDTQYVPRQSREGSAA